MTIYPRTILKVMTSLPGPDQQTGVWLQILGPLTTPNEFLILDMFQGPRPASGLPETGVTAQES